MAMSQQTTQRTVYVFKDDIRRINTMYTRSGNYGMVNKLIQQGTHLAVYLEEIARGREHADASILAAIHTLQTALNERDCREDDARTAQTTISPQAQEIGR